MNDSDYIKPSERLYRSDGTTHRGRGELRLSHAVADEIARELAEALREMGVGNYEQLTTKRTALARYDKVMGDG